MKRIFGSVIIMLSVFLLAACSLPKNNQIQLIDAKMATAIDEKLMPIKVADTFPQGTAKVFCWLSWKNAQVNTPITAKWRYITDDVHILDYNFAIPRKEGTGSVSLAMPEGKNLPSGQYKVELSTGKRALKTITFKVL